MNPVLFVINPVSGGQKKGEVIERIEGKFPGGAFVIYETTGEKDRERITELIRKNNFKSVVAGGGDGTIGLVARIIKGKDIALGILPLGSANGLATELNIPVNLDDSLELILKGEAKPFDLILINEKWNLLHLADLGLNATLVKRYQEDQHRGFLGYTVSAIKELPNLSESIEFEIITDGDVRTFQSHFVAIANAKKYGTGIIINPKGSISDGQFEICVLNEISFEKFLEKFLGKEEFELDPFTIISAREATIKPKKETDFQIDGEYLGKVNHLDVKIQEGALKIIF